MTSENASNLAVVGSPSTCDTAVLNLSRGGYDKQLLGTMLAFEKRFADDSTELALGTVTKVETINPVHTASAAQGLHIAAGGAIHGQSGNDGDTRAVTIKIEAVFRHWNGAWRKHSSTLSNSPNTGTPVRVLDQATTDALMADNIAPAYIGCLRGSGVLIPFTLNDFAGPRGSRHMAILGATGAGKSLSCETPMATPTGWVRMGDLNAGDQVFDERGIPCTVNGVFDQPSGRECFEVSFSDGSILIADGEHLWETSTRAERVSALHGRRERQRRTLLGEEVRERLLETAAASPTGELMTVPEAWALAGVNEVPNFFYKNVVPRLDGGVLVPVTKTYSTSGGKVEIVQNVDVYDSQRLCKGLLDFACSSAQPRGLLHRSISTLDQIAGGPPAEVTVPDLYAALVGDRRKPTSAFRRAVATTGVTPHRRAIPIAHVRKPLDQLRGWSEVIHFPTQVILRAVAEYGARIVNDQRTGQHSTSTVRSTRQIAASLTTASGHVNHSIPLAKPLQFPDQHLLIDPYVLGAWLGDGTSRTCGFTTADDQMVDNIRAAGYTMNKHAQKYQWGIGIRDDIRADSCPHPRSNGRTTCWECYRTGGRFGAQLEIIGVRRNKHIPGEYMRGSIPQRRALLAGLLDTDGTVTAAGGVQFASSDLRLADDVMALAASLGYRPTMTSKMPTRNGHVYRRAYTVSFPAEPEVFRLDRKQTIARERRPNATGARTSARYVTRIKPVDEVPMRCIAVDSPSRLYLAGKTLIPTHNTVFSSYVLANMLRWANMGQIILDPQGQWATEHGLPFSLQGIARATGRSVHVARLSHSLRLRKDARLFLNLLTEAKWFKHLAFGAGADENIAQARDVLNAALQDKKSIASASGCDDWTEARPDALMRYLLTVLHDILPAGTVYAGREQQERVARTIRRPTLDSSGEPIPAHILDKLPHGALDPDGVRKFTQMLVTFSALHSLWSPYSPAGVAKISAGATAADLDDSDRRRDAWGLMRKVMAPDTGRPAPWLIFDLSADLSQLNLSHDDGTSDELMAATQLLDTAEVKARIMSQLLNTMKLAGQQEFNRGGQLNVQVVVDEAWQYAGPVEPKSQSEALVSLSNQFAGDCRDVRKFGIGFAFILQAATGLRDDIWKQLAVLMVGYGLHDQADMKRLGGRVSDGHLALYRTAPPPEATGRYTWMCVGGGVTGLSFGSNPVFLEAFTDPGDWLRANESWVTVVRREFSHALPDGDGGGRLTSIPRRPGFDDAAMAAHARRDVVVNGRANSGAVADIAARLRGSAGKPPAWIASKWAHGSAHWASDDTAPF